MNQDALALVNVQELIESRTLTFWQKYVKGVNMTFINCEHGLEHCNLVRDENQFYFIVNYKDVDFIEVNENVSYHSSLIIPIFKEIGSIVNYSVHLYVSTLYEKQWINPYWVTSGCIDGVDNVPMIYEKELRSGLGCAQPLYISNQISILSPVVKRERPETLDLWKAFDKHVWICIPLAFLFVIIINKLISKITNKNKKINTLFELIWIYWKPLIGIGERLRYHNYLFLLWVISVFPLTEIFKNKLLVNLVAVPDNYANNIDDLLDDKWDVYTSHIDLKGWRESIDLPQKFNNLFNKTKPLDFNQDGEWFSLIDEPKLFIRKLKRSVLFEDDQALKFFNYFMKRFLLLHFGTDSYIPELITPLCYPPNFQFKKEAHEVTLRLFESSFFNYWSEVKSNFYLTVAFKIIDMLKGDILKKILNHKSLFTPLELINIKSLFSWLLYCSTLTSIVLVIENLYSLCSKNYSIT